MPACRPAPPPARPMTGCSCSRAWARSRCRPPRPCPSACARGWCARLATRVIASPSRWPMRRVRRSAGCASCCSAACRRPSASRRSTRAPGRPSSGRRAPPRPCMRRCRPRTRWTGSKPRPSGPRASGSTATTPIADRSSRPAPASWPTRWPNSATTAPTSAMVPIVPIVPMVPTCSRPGSQPPWPKSRRPSGGCSRTCSRCAGAARRRR